MNKFHGMARMQTLGAVGVLALGLLTSTAHAASVYTSEADFLDHLEAGYLFSDFEGLPDWPGTSYSFDDASSLFSYDAAAAYGLWGSFRTLSVQHPSDVLRIDFTGAGVTAVGGYFFGTDGPSNVVSSTIYITLGSGADGAFTQTFTNVDSSDHFVGFVTNSPIEWMEIEAEGKMASQFISHPTLDNFYVGATSGTVVPTPAAAGAGLVLLGLLGASRGRRQRQRV